jgi:excisionase family DNA binding protein
MENREGQNEYRRPLTPMQVADRLGLCRNTVGQLLRSKRLRSVRVGRKYLIPHEAVEEFLRGATR